MRKIITAIILTMILLVTLTSCSKPAETDDNNGEEETMNYKDLYKTEITEPYAILPSFSNFKASYGYTLKCEQGYNNWYYQAGGSFNDMTYDYEKKMWNYEDSYFNNGIFMPGANNAAALMFKAQINGNVHLKGNFMMNTAGDSAGIRITVNGTSVYPSTGMYILDGSDVEGMYYDFEQILNKDDEVRFIVDANGGSGQEIYWNPSVEYSSEAEQSLHYNVNGQFFGDVHPFYNDGKMYMYYLKTGGTFQSQLALSQNMINYDYTTLYQDETNMPEMEAYYVIGVYKDGDVFRTYFGLANAMGSAKSSDLITWSNGTETGPNYTTLYKCWNDYNTFPAGSRDPFAFYDPDIDRVRLVGLYYHKNSNGELDRSIGLRTTSNPEGSIWEDTGKSLVRFPTRPDGEPECPMMMKIGNRWYLFASLGLKSIHNVGGLTYWMGGENTKIDDDNWSEKEQLRLDGEDLCAAQLVKVGDKIYVYGWMPQQYNTGEWGGYLNIAREVIVREDGTLGSRLDPEMTKLLNRGKLYELRENCYSGISGNFTYSENKVTSQTAGDNQILLDGQYKRTFVTYDMKIGDATKAGFVMTQGANRYEVIITKDINGTYMQIGNPYDGSHSVSSSIRIGDNSLTEFSIKAVIEGSIIEFFVNDNWALSGRTSMTLEFYQANLYSNGLNTEFTNVKINKLASASDILD